MSDGAHDNFLDRKETPPHPVEWRGYYIDQKHYDDIVAELARLRSLLAGAYTVTPLVWVPYTTFEWCASSGTGFTVRRHSTVEGKWVLYVGAMCMWREFETPDAAKQEAEKMHRNRVTAELTKVEAQ